MTKRRQTEVPPACLYWGGLSLYAASFKVAEIIPRWPSMMVPTGAPLWWEVKVGADEPLSHTEQTPQEAMKRAEWVVLMQLASLGQRRVSVRRQDGTGHILEVPHGTY